MSQYRDSMGRAENAAGNAMDEARSRINDGLDSAKTAASDAKDFVSTKWNDARDSVSHMGDDIRDRFDSIRDADYDEMWDGVKNSVRDNPGPALLLAGAIGLAIGVLVVGSGAAASRRRR